MWKSDYQDSLGERGVHVLPSNQSILLADSRTRDDPNSSVTNFKMSCDRVRMKEFYYNSLFWKQSLYTHNLTNCQVRYRFQFNDGVNPVTTSPIYICFAQPFVTYTSFDGNAAGSVYATPNPNAFSYAQQMEYAFNHDYRLESQNLNPMSAYYMDWVSGPADGITVFFRYNSSKGFALWAVDANQIYPAGSVTIQILQCDWIQNGHQIHGFGYPYPQYQPINASENQSLNIQPPVYGPNPSFLGVYYAESQPTLLPFRYIVILSPELTKDRRIPSFHSGNLNRFSNEIALFSLDLANMGIWHQEAANEDSTVVSIRDNYAPQSMTFEISSENGDTLIPSTFFSTLMNDPNLLYANKIQFLTLGRFAPQLMNAAVYNQNVLTAAYQGAIQVQLNQYGNGASHCLPDDVIHELTVVIRDN